MALLLQSVGIVASIRVRWMNKSTRPAHVVRVAGYEQLLALREVFGSKHVAMIDQMLAGYERHIRQHGFQRFDGFVTLKVLEVTPPKRSIRTFTTWRRAPAR